MIQSVTVTNHRNESIKMELRFPEKSGFLIRGIDGLNPVKADVSISQVTTTDGGVYNSARANERNIIFKLGVYWYPDPETVRQKIYKYFPLKKKIKILIESDNRTAYVYGYVESNEINIFSEDEESIISVLCPESYLLDVNMEHEIFSSTTSTFEFPFSAESPDYLELSTLELFYTKVITYEGDAEVGIVLKMHAIGTATNIEILNVDTGDSITIDTTKLAAIVGSGITSGDDIIISTIPGDKYAILIRSGTTYNIYNALDKYPGWFLLEKGDNTFTYDADTGVANLQFQMDYQNSYEGI